MFTVRYFYFVFLGFAVSLCFLFGFGCQTPPVESIDQSNVVATEKSEDSNEPLKVEPAVVLPVTFDSATFLPPNATLISLVPLSLDEDMQPEYAMLFKVEDAPVLETIDDISYLRVYRFEDNSWQIIKEDQRRENTGVGQVGNFNQVEVVRFEAADRDYLLVSKGHAWGGAEGYYLFGQVSEGVFDDLPIPKAYLHSDLYLEPGDEYISLESVTPSSTGLTEHYGVACEGRDAHSHFGDSPTTGYCRYIDVFQTFTEKGFETQPVIIKVTPN